MTDAKPCGPRGLAHIDTWIFDLDNTLYPASCRLFDQVDTLIARFIMDHLGVDQDEARRIQKRYFLEHGTTLAGLMTHHAIDPHLYLDYVHRLDLSGLPPSPALDAALGRLPGRKIVYTNGSAGHAERVMTRLGIHSRFEGVFDIVAGDFVPKPHEPSYRRMIERHGVDPTRAAMIEDLPRNLAPAAALGMTTVLVRSGAPWAEEGAGADYIHHVTDDLVAWLESAVPPPSPAAEAGAAPAAPTPPER
ncbi:MAG: pyrimidine 5'-nucleotidase [Rhodospirillaceae bacterium]|nr:pyrimidine 5'-nucleotidase [Rhodospirillaceae bacterium]